MFAVLRESLARAQDVKASRFRHGLGEKIGVRAASRFRVSVRASEYCREECVVGEYEQCAMAGAAED